MHDAVIEPMYPNLSIEKDRQERLWKVVIIERDEMGRTIRNNPNDITWRLNLTYDEAFYVR